MPLPLEDPRWGDLKTSYGSTADLIARLALAHADCVTGELLGDLVNEINHQGTSSEAMYAVTPHFLLLADTASEEVALELVIHAGLIHAAARLPGAAVCPEFLREEFEATARTGAERIGKTIVTAADFDGFKYQVSALAGFLGLGRFAHLINGFDFFEDRFHHASLDEPFDES